MNVLGLSYNYHDASSAIVTDGQVIFAAAEERYSRLKHDPSFPAQSAQAAMNRLGLKPDDLDYIVFHEDPTNKLTRSLATSLARWPLSLNAFLHSGRDAVASTLRIHQEIAQKIGVDPRKIRCIPHHMSHAALAFMTSPYTTAAVMTIDAVGEWTSSAIFSADRSSGKLKIEPLDVAPFPNSLGLFYSAMTSYLGFKVNDGECSTMALAAFGDPIWLEQMRQIVRIDREGRHSLDTTWLDLRSDTELPVSAKFLKCFGPSRSFKNKITLDCLGSHLNSSKEDQHFADIAASVQAVLEEAVLAYAQRAARLTGLPNLCYAGGVALNCVANARLHSAHTFDSIFIPADPGDGGAALGAALYVSGLCGETASQPSVSCYSGDVIEDENLEEILPQLQPKLWRHFSDLSTPGLASLRWQRLSESELAQTVANFIANGKIVGWARGRFEQGPRALGARSILIRADNPNLARRLSARVKKRAGFRPYALAITESEARRILVLPDTPEFPHASRWMQMSFQVRESFVPAVKAGLHIDGTTRAQIVDVNENPCFNRLIECYRQVSGIGAVINTSMNEGGSPLAVSSFDALIMFARTEMDVLVVGNLIIEKETQ